MLEEPMPLITSIAVAAVVASSGVIHHPLGTTCAALPEVTWAPEVETNHIYFSRGLRPAISFTANCIDQQGRSWSFDEWVDIAVPSDGFDYYRKKCWKIGDRCFAQYAGVMRRFVLEP